MLYTWYLRLNHTYPSIIRSMAAQPVKTWATLPTLPCARTRPLPRLRDWPYAVHLPPPGTSRPPLGHTVATDIAGPYPPTPEGFKYFLTFIELHIRHAIVVLLRKRSEAEQHIRSVLTRLGRHLGRPIVRLRSDNANGFCPNSSSVPFPPWISHLTLLHRISQRKRICRTPEPYSYGPSTRNNYCRQNALHHRLGAMPPRHHIQIQCLSAYRHCCNPTCALGGTPKPILPFSSALTFPWQLQNVRRVWIYSRRTPHQRQIIPSRVAGALPIMQDR